MGGLLLDANGNRFADELGHRDYVTGQMWKGKGPFRLVLNGKGGNEIIWHCKVRFFLKAHSLSTTWDVDS